MDVFGARSNVISGVAHVAVKAATRLALKLDAHVFSRPQASGTGHGDGYNGAEFDLSGVYSLGKGLNLQGLYGIFLPSDVYPTQDAIHYLEVGLEFAF